MLPVTAMKRLEALATISTQGKPINGLFRLLETPMLWDAVYATIYANAGALTVGVDSVTLDGFSQERVTTLITRLKTGMYRPQPTRRTYVPKANGKKRPLGISSGDDKLLQEVVRIILEKIYEPIFAESSHGFRPGRSPHSAVLATSYIRSRKMPFGLSSQASSLCQVGLSHPNGKGIVLVHQRKHWCRDSKPLGKACTGCRRGL